MNILTEKRIEVGYSVSLEVRLLTMRVSVIEKELRLAVIGFFILMVIVNGFIIRYNGHMVVTWIKHEDGRRCYVLGKRLHHGTSGIGVLIAGIILIAHDWKDRKAWFNFSEKA